MRRYISVLLAAVILLGCMFSGLPVAKAAKATEARTIAIVFDNSGSMYLDNRQEWCRATYAMEVFASMLNKGDVLQIYPMHPITVGGKQYTMESPLQITDSAQASTIREIYTEKAEGTPIESIDCAVKGLKTAKTNKRYMIVLTDGTEFDENDKVLYGKNTVKALDARISANAGKEMTIMYLGIGKNASMPDTAESEYFIKKKADNSDLVLSTLTYMCNQIFGRDTLPKNHMSGNQIDFDISMSKLIVFVQGENIANLKLTGNGVGTLVSSQQTKYSTAGAGGSYKDKCNPDTSLQGMMVTYTDCAAGSYTIDFTGDKGSIEVYYEPDADLDFVFTDAAGNTVDPNALYEGDYKVSFGMKDGKTGKLITSDLLGNPHYNGSYSINGKEQTFTHDGSSGVVTVALSMDDAFDAKLTVNYLSGYTISKDSTDFGWPKGGIKVAARPAGDMYLEVSGGEDQYSLQDLEKGAPYIVKVFYKGTQLTGDALKSVAWTWDAEGSNAEMKWDFADDHYKVSLHYKNPEAPQDTVCGECKVPIVAAYAEKGSSEAKAQGAITYNIKDDFSPLRLEMYAPQDYFVINQIQDGQEIVANLKLNGAPLSAEDFAAVAVQVDCGGIEYALTPHPEDSSYSIKLLPTEGIEKGNYKIKVSATYKDHIGRETTAENAVVVTLSNVSLLTKWAITIGILLLLFFIIWRILHIRVFPKKINKNQPECTMNFDNQDVTADTIFRCERQGKELRVTARYAGDVYGVMMTIDRGKEAYLMKASKKRRIAVKADSVKKLGTAWVQEVIIGSRSYEYDQATSKITPVDQPPKDFEVGNGCTIDFNGKENDFDSNAKSYAVSIKVLFK